MTDVDLVLIRSQGLLASSGALTAQARAARAQSIRLQGQAMELRFQHRQLVRETSARLEEVRKRCEASLPSPWSPLRYRLPDREIDKILVAV